MKNNVVRVLPRWSFTHKAVMAVLTTVALTMASPSSADTQIEKKKSSFVVGKALDLKNDREQAKKEEFLNGVGVNLDLNALRTGNMPLSTQLSEIAKGPQIDTPPMAEPKVDRSFFLNADSGIYTNPLSPNDYLTLHFTNDVEAETRIQADATQYKISNPSYDEQVQMLGKLLDAGSKAKEGINVSAHVPLPTEKGRDDMNIVIIDPVSSGDQRSDFYDNYAVFIHEAAHALSFQEVSTSKLTWMSNSDRFEQTLFRENASDYIATIKLAQLMHEDGANRNQILDMIDSKIQRRSKLAFDNENQRPSESSHYTSPSLLVVKRLMKNHPETLLGLTNDEIISDADVVSKALIDKDFGQDIKKVFETEPSLLEKPDIVQLMKHAKTSDKVASFGSVSNPIVQHLLNNEASVSVSRFAYEMERELTTEPKQQHSLRVAL
jgi:hypothetical protein